MTSRWPCRAAFICVVSASAMACAGNSESSFAEAGNDQDTKAGVNQRRRAQKAFEAAWDQYAFQRGMPFVVARPEDVPQLECLLKLAVRDNEDENEWDLDRGIWSWDFEGTTAFMLKREKSALFVRRPFYVILADLNGKQLAVGSIDPGLFRIVYKWETPFAQCPIAEVGGAK